MAAFSSIIAGIGLAIGVAGAVQQRQQAKRQQRALDRASEEDQKAQAQQAAQNSFQQAQEQRQQIREERVRRAQILQSAENSGAAGSSGSLGAVGGLSTNLSTNVGANRSAANTGQMITGFRQASADFQTDARRFGNRANTAGQISGLGMNAFNAAGGFGTLFKAGSRMFSGTGGPAPMTDRWAGATGSVF